MVSQRVLGTVMGDTSPNHNSNSYYRNPTFYLGTLDPLGLGLRFMGLRFRGSGFRVFPLPGSDVYMGFRLRVKL